MAVEERELDLRDELKNKTALSKRFLPGATVVLVAAVVMLGWGDPSPRVWGGMLLAITASAAHISSRFILRSSRK